jgi:hypothetical protein
MLEIRLPGVADPKVRCALCADEPLPATLTPLVEYATRITPMLRIPTGVNTLPLDFKRRQWREPGDDD